MTCRLCKSTSVTRLFSKQGSWSLRSFDICRCESCDFVFVAEPWVDYDQIYTEDYYAGRGADPLVDYLGELEHFSDSVRRYEWRGIYRRVASLTALGRESKWLDYGCGAGGLVKYLNIAGCCDAVGFEQGWAASKLSSSGVPLIDSEALIGAKGTFSVITAVEVIEHVLDPIGQLREMRELLSPGGVLFLTTGNPEPYWDKLSEWPYILPEVHISFFRPKTLAFALEQSGFVAEFAGYGPGWTDILRFKILKNLGRRRVSSLERLVPWALVCRVADRRYRVSAQPSGRVVQP